MNRRVPLLLLAAAVTITIGCQPVNEEESSPVAAGTEMVSFSVSGMS